jgi:nucleotide-binding universal stress UspA family protein
VAEIRHIHCPVNNTPLARRAWGLAVELAACTGARLTALHVHEDGAPGPARIEDLCAWLADQPRPPDCTVRDLTQTGEPAREIVRAAAETGADLIVLGAAHKRFFDTAVLGSTTVRVTRHAPVPVLVAFGENNESSAA